jgi:hypothetical protein
VTRSDRSAVFFKRRWVINFLVFLLSRAKLLVDVMKPRPDLKVSRWKFFILEEKKETVLSQRSHFERKKITI